MKRVFALILCFVLVFSCIAPASAAGYVTTVTYSCRAHNGCMYVKFASHGDKASGDVYDYYFSANKSHWPNAFRYDRTWSYKVGTTGYAKGTYTIYSSLVTQWASLSFSSSSKTLTHTY